MMVKIIRLLFAFILIAGFFSGQNPAQSAPADDAQVMFSQLSPTWRTGPLNTSPDAGTEVADVNGDGVREILSCNGASAYALNYAGAGEYTDIWFSPRLRCSHVALMIRPGGAYQILIYGMDHYLTVYNASNFSQAARFLVPDAVEVRDLLAGDVDSDGTPEIVLVADLDTYILNGLTYALEWKAAGMGGRQASMGNIDTDPAIELVIKGDEMAYVLNAAARAIEWDWTGGFGKDMDLGDIDGDGRAEIVYFDGWNGDYIYAYEPDTNTNKWILGPFNSLDDLAVRDIDGGAAEVLIGSIWTDSVSGLRGSDGAEVFSISVDVSGLAGITTGDPDNDGLVEVMFVADDAFNDASVLFVGDWQTETIEWQASGVFGMHLVRAADVDTDGEMEIVVSNASGSRGGVVRVFAALTHELEWQASETNLPFYFTFLDVGQLDSDPQLEILVAANYSYGAYLRVYDGLSGEQEWQSESLGFDLELKHLLVAQVDSDPVEEIIYALEDGVITFLNGAGGDSQWTSPSQGGIMDLVVGDTDGNGVTDLAVLTISLLRVYNAATHALITSQPLTQARQVALKPPDTASPGMYLVLSAMENERRILRAYSLTGFHPLWERQIASMHWEPCDLITADVEGDGVTEYILTGSYGGEFTYDGSALLIGGFDYPNFTEFTPRDDYGVINHVDLADLDGNGDLELLFSATDLIQVNEVSARPMHLSHVSEAMFKGCSPRYADTFDDPTSGWPVGSDAYASANYAGGKYAVSLFVPQFWIALTSGALMGDGQLVVDVAPASAWYSSQGLVFGIGPNWDSFYTFEIDAIQNYSLFYYDGEWTGLVGGSSPAIRSGNATNRLKVERSGMEIRLYANDTLLNTWTSSNNTGELRVGLITTSYDQGGVEIRFDNFAVFTLGCGTSGQFGSTFTTLGLEALRQPQDGLAGETRLSGPNSRR